MESPEKAADPRPDTRPSQELSRYTYGYEYYDEEDD